jgi:hypothetical protein
MAEPEQVTLPYWVPLGPAATREKLQMEAPDALTADGLDAALVGVGLRDGALVACYSMQRCAKALVDVGISQRRTPGNTWSSIPSVLTWGRGPRSSLTRAWWPVPVHQNRPPLHSSPQI